MSNDSKSMVLDFLREDPGRGYGINAMAGILGIGPAAVRIACAELMAQKLIREIAAGRTARYRVPDEQEVALERRLSEKRDSFMPLRRRNDHAEAVARAKASRLDYQPDGV